MIAYPRYFVLAIFHIPSRNLIVESTYYYVRTFKRSLCSETNIKYKKRMSGSFPNDAT